MDDQDALWLSLLNQDKAETKGRPCSSELFERVMDRLEKEWFELVIFYSLFGCAAALLPSVGQNSSK